MFGWVVKSWQIIFLTYSWFSQETHIAQSFLFCSTFIQMIHDFFVSSAMNSQVKYRKYCNLKLLFHFDALRPNVIWQPTKYWFLTCIIYYLENPALYKARIGLLAKFVLIPNSCLLQRSFHESYLKIWMGFKSILCIIFDSQFRQ